MLFTQEIQEKLKAICDGKSKIVIEGFNSIGDPFVTKGRIAKGDSGEPAVQTDAVFLDFGKPTDKSHSDFVGSFSTEYDVSRSAAMILIVKRIGLENGEVLFENQDAAKYLDAAKRNMEEYEDALQSNGSLIDEYDDVSKELMTLVGRPVRIINEGEVKHWLGEKKEMEGVLVEPPRIATDFNGSAIISFYTAGGVLKMFPESADCAFVDENFRIEVLNVETGEVEYEVSNGQQTKEILLRRKEKIESAKKQGQSQPGDGE